MINARISLASLFILALVFGVYAQPAATSVVEFMPLSKVREGMQGKARTVFRGSRSEEFNVEILGLIPGGIGPKQDLIVGRISGGSADRTSVFAGMSGSPVYIDGKLVGAISYSFPFSKEPICGITPIEQMISIFERKENAGPAAEPRPISFAEIASTEWLPDTSRGIVPSGTVPSAEAGSRLAAVAGQSFQPIATPITFSGFRQETLDAFAPYLLKAGLLPVSAAGGAAPISPMKKPNETTLLGGDSVSMHLTRGDYSLAASGTVTLRNGDKIYAFGHPFLSLGTSDLPMSESHVVTVIPNINNSFKLAVPDDMVGAMTQDRATGVFGKLGQAPRMIPVQLEIETSRGVRNKISFEVARDDFLTPLLLNIAVYNSVIAQERTIGDTMIAVSGTVNLKGSAPVKIERRFAGGTASQLAAASVAIPVQVLFKSRFSDLEISSIEISLASTDGSRTAVLDRIALDRSRLRAGETIEVQAFARTNYGRTFVQRIPITVPADAPPGQYSVTVGDGSAIQQSASAQHFVPRDIGELVRTMNRIKRPDRLYAVISRTSVGAIIGASELPNLPPSILATLNSDRAAGGVKPAVLTVLSEKELDPAEFIVSGQQTLTIEVIR